MLKKLTRYYQTLKHLKPLQIRYQLWYRFRNKFFPVQYPLGIQAPTFQKLELAPFPEQYTDYLGDKHFQFLNLEQNFKDEINWNYLGQGKLWAYHLNYFDYLHQPKMDWETGKKLIYSFLEDSQNRHQGMEPYPISLRTINLIKFMIKHDTYPQEIVDFLYAQYQVLSKKIEYQLLANHLLENGFSLLFGAVFFQDERLIRLSRKILKSELEEQILKDGAHYELSPMYQVILLQRALDGYNLLINNNHKLLDVKDHIKGVIYEMVNWLHTIMFSNGDIPMLNDSTGDQALEPKVILRYAQQLGFIPKKIQMKESGYRKFEFGDFEMIADVGEVGPTYQPGHAHSDTLSFVLYCQRKPIIVDRGISTYEKNQIRQDERATASHNTVVINSKEQTDVWGGFRVGRRAKPVIMEESESFLKASHTGYDRLGVRHVREWQIQEKQLLILDKIIGKVDECVAYIHFDPEVLIEQLEKGTYKINNTILTIKNAISIDIEDYFFCLGFNKSETAKRLLIIFSDELKTYITE